MKSFHLTAGKLLIVLFHCVEFFFSSLGAHLSGWTIIGKLKKNAKLSCNMITLRYVTLSRGVQDRTLFLIAVTAEY